LKLHSRYTKGELIIGSIFATMEQTSGFNCFYNCRVDSIGEKASFGEETLVSSTGTASYVLESNDDCDKITAIKPRREKLPVCQKYRA
jgi:hypothetical protein